MSDTPWPRGKRKAATKADAAFSRLKARIRAEQARLTELLEATEYLANNVRKQRLKVGRLITRYESLTADAAKGQKDLT